MSGNRVASLSCCHTFHAVCILEWLRQSSTCPLCKQTVFHPLTLVARQQNQQLQQQQQQQDEEQQQSAVDGLSSRMGALSMAPAASSSSSCASKRAQSAAALTAESRARIRQLRLEHQRAEEAYDSLQSEQSASHSRAASKATASQRASSAANKAKSSVQANASPYSLTQQLQAAAAHDREEEARAAPLHRVGSASSSRGSARSSLGAGGADALSRTLSLNGASTGSRLSSAADHSSARSSGSSSSQVPNGSPARPSSNSSSIRAAAAAQLSLARTPLVSRTGKLATGSTAAKARAK